MTPGDYVCLSVTDTGAGMPPDVVARAFDPFFTTKPTGQGTGLGLSMVYGFVRQSGGNVRIHSAPGEGTTVRLCLPQHLGDDAAGAAEAAEPLAPASRPPPGRRCWWSRMSRWCATWWSRCCATSATARWRRRMARRRWCCCAPGQRLDLLVTDVGLPGGMNGRQLADAARETRPGLKVLFVTGYADVAGLAGDVLEPGMALIPKPFEAAVLARRIRELIEER